MIISSRLGLIVTLMLSYVTRIFLNIEELLLTMATRQLVNSIALRAESDGTRHGGF